MAPKASAERTRVPEVSRVLQPGRDHHQGRSLLEHRLQGEFGRLHQGCDPLRMLGHGGAQKDLLGHDQHFCIAYRKLVQQRLVAAAHKHCMQLQAALHRFLHQVQAFDGDVGNTGAARQARAQLFDAGVLPAFHPSRTTFGNRLHAS